MPVGKRTPMTTPLTIRGLGGGQTNLLGLWALLPPASLTFSAVPVSASETTAALNNVVWSVSLPGHPALAMATMEQQAQGLQMARQALAQGEVTLHTLARQGEESTAFAYASATSSLLPATTLCQHLAQLQHGGEELSFGL